MTTTTYYMIGPSSIRAAIASLADALDCMHRVRCIHRWWEVIDREPADASEGSLREYGCSCGLAIDEGVSWVERAIQHAAGLSPRVA